MAATPDNNHNDFLSQIENSCQRFGRGANNIKVASVADFAAGRRSRLIRARAARLPSSRRLARQAAPRWALHRRGRDRCPVASAAGFGVGQTITIDSGTNLETAVVGLITGGGGRGGRGGRGAWGTSSSLLRRSLLRIGGRTGLRHWHHLHTALDPGTCQRTLVGDNGPTPGAPNQYRRAQ